MSSKVLLNFFVKGFILSFFSLFFTSHIFAEGTREVQLTDTSHGRIQVMPWFSDFAIKNSPPEHRLHIKISDTTERICIGFGDVRDYYGTFWEDVTYTIKSPSGVLVAGPDTLPLPGQSGYINTYAEAVTGPNIANPAGYNPIIFNPSEVGDYYIEFDYSKTYGFVNIIAPETTYFPIGTAEFGENFYNVIFDADLAYVLDNDSSYLGCVASGYPTNSLLGKIALIDRGLCNFSKKVYNAQNAGAIGVIIVNNVPGELPLFMLSGLYADSVTIPSIMITYEDGEKVREWLDSNKTVTAEFGSLTYGYERRVFELFDIAVVNSNDSIIRGRLWSKEWQFTTIPYIDLPNAFLGQFDGKAYIYADDGIVTSIDFNRIQPFVFSFTANETGCFNTGNVVEDRKSVYGNHTYPQYKLFLNNPDSLCYPTGILGSITSPTTITGCPGDFCIYVNVDKAGYVEVLLNFNGIPGYQPASSDVLLTADVSPGANCIPWDGLDGLGQEIPQGAVVPIKVNYFNGLTHLPLYDVEANEHGYIVEVVRPPSPNPQLRVFWDDTNIIGGDSNLFGCLTATGCHTWSMDSCLNVPIPDYCSLGDMRTINTWWYAHTLADTFYFFFDYVMANANLNSPPGMNDTTICSHIDTIQLNGFIQHAPSALWSGGSGSFYPSDTLLNAYYVFSQNDKDNGYATLVLSTQGGNCPPVTDTITISFITPQLTLVSDTNVICYGDTVQLMAGGLLTYSWAPASSLNDAHAAHPLAFPSSTTAYTVTATDANGCFVIDTIVIEVLPLPTANAGQNNSICEGDTVQLNASGGLNYEWAPSASLSDAYTAHPLASPSTTTTYSVTVTDAFGCSETDQMILTVNDLPQVFAGNDTAICFLDSIQLNATGGIIYEWVPAALVDQNHISNPFAFPDQTTLFTVIATDSNGCSNYDSLVIFVNPLPIADAGQDTTICQGDIVTLNAGGGVTYQWSPHIGLNDPAIQNPLAMPTATTTYTVQVTDINGCTAIDSVTVSLFPQPSASFTFNDVCLNEAVDFLSNSHGHNITEIWDFGDGSPMDTTSSVSHMYNMADVYNVSLYVVSGYGCIDSVSQSVNVFPLPEAAFSISNACAGDAAEFFDMSTVQSPHVIDNWHWQFGDNPSSVSTLQNPLHVYQQDSIFFVQLIVQTDHGCLDTIIQAVEVYPNPVADFEAVSEGCSEFCTSFNDLSYISSGSIVDRLWEFGNMTNSTQQTPLACFANSDHTTVSLFDVTLTVTSDNNCVTSVTKPDYITVYPVPYAAFTHEPNRTTIEDPMVRFYDNSIGATSWLWSFGNLANSSSSQNPTHSFNDAGEYYVNLTVQNVYGCTDSVGIYLNISPDRTIYVPSAFTPNGDGHNDYFTAYGRNIYSYQMYIFDRWGGLVFKTDDINLPWYGDNIFTNEPCMQGVYIYLIYVKDANGVKHRHYGSVTLLR